MTVHNWPPFLKRGILCPFAIRLPGDVAPAASAKGVRRAPPLALTRACPHTHMLD